MKFLSAMALWGVCLSSCIFAGDKFYIDEKMLEPSGHSFHVHVGNNEWLKTNTVHRDSTGLYAYDSDFHRVEGKKDRYEKEWKCPYCHMHWPIGKSCKNPDCPSRYKD